MPTSKVNVGFIVDYHLYSLSGNDEITDFLIRNNKDIIDYDVHLPWPSDYFKDDDHKHYNVEYETWGLRPIDVVEMSEDIKADVQKRLIKSRTLAEMKKLNEACKEMTDKINKQKLGIITFLRSFMTDLNVLKDGITRPKYNRICGETRSSWVLGLLSKRGYVV